MKTTRRFLKEMQRVHTELSAPCTLFVRGATLEQSVPQFQALKENPLFDLQQHTYSHLIFKKIDVFVDGEHLTHGNDEPVEKIKADVAKASDVFEKNLGFRPLGLTTPYAFYLGLKGRPDILEALHTVGIRFIRSYGRNKVGYSPVPLEVQPFFYVEEGFPDILELPANGWQDCYWRERYGYKANWERQIYTDLDYVAERDYFLALVQHDWSSIREDKKMQRTKAIILYAQKIGVRIISYRQYYEEMIK